MAKRWKRRPEGANWGEFGDDDPLGRVNLLTAERRLRALQEVKTGRVFCLSHPLDRPGGSVLNANRKPPVLQPMTRDGHLYFNLAFEKIDPRYDDVGSDEAVLLYTQYSTHWDGFPHKGMLFDADGDGVEEKVFYNGYSIVDAQGRGSQGEIGAVHLGIDGLAATGVQGRAVMIDLRHHYRHRGDRLRQSRGGAILHARRGPAPAAPRAGAAAAPALPGQAGDAPRRAVVPDRTGGVAARETPQPLPPHRAAAAAARRRRVAGHAGGDRLV